MTRLFGPRVPGGRAEARRIRRLERECRALLRRLDLPLPLDITALCDGIAAERGRPIHLLPIPAVAGGPVASWWSTDSIDVIFFVSDVEPLLQFHSIAHELGHLLAGHCPDNELDPAALVEGVFPRLEAKTLRRMFGRNRQHGYDELAEWEAEQLGSTLRWWSDLAGDHPIAAVRSTQDAMLQRLTAALTERRGWL